MLILLLGLTSCYNEWVFRPEINGKILDSNTDKPIVGFVETIPVEGEKNEIVKSNEEGVFKLPKLSSSSWTFLGMEKPKGPPTTNLLIIQSVGYVSDTVDFTGRFSRKNNKLDLGDVRLKKIK